MKEIQLTQGKIAIVDDEDYDWLNKYEWHYNGYAVRTEKKDKSGKRIAIRMHREVMGNPDGFEIDHINGNKCDNRKENLRICSSYENSLNRKRHNRSKLKSKYKGVFPKNKSYIAYITVNKKRIELGTFIIEEAAAMAYNIAAINFHKEYANLNDINLPNWESYRVKKGTSEFNGVYRYKGYKKNDNRWIAQISYNKKHLHLGIYQTEIDAAIAYNRKSLEIYGLDNKLNNIDTYVLPNRICINGRSLSGKDTIADILCKSFGYTKIGFAIPIYVIARDLFGMTTKDRKLLQDIGTALRSIDQDIFVKWALNEAKKYDKVVISDVRNENEYNYLTNDGFFPIRVTADFDLRIQRCIKRDGIYPDTSLWETSNETGADNCIYKVEIENNGTFAELYDKILQLHDFKE